MIRKLVELLRRPRLVTGIAALAAVVLGLPSLRIGFLLDDWVHRYAVLGYPGPVSGLRLFDFATGDPARTAQWIRGGPLPWWTDPELRLSFFRPLSSALVYVDEVLFGDRAWLHHLHSVAWGLAVVLAAVLLYRKLLGSGALAGAAIVFFAVDDAHWMPVSWLANRNSIVGLAPALLGFAAHVAWRRDGWKPGAWLGAAGLAVGLCGAEAAVAMVAFVVAYEVFGRAEPSSVRARALVPTALVIVGYAAVYKAGGYGAKFSGVYLDPLRDPLALLQEAPARFLALVGALGLNLPVDLWLSAPAVRGLLVGLGVATIGLFAWLVAGARARATAEEGRLIVALCAGTVLAILPSLATFPASRLVLVASVGAAPLLAFIVRDLWRQERWRVLTILVVLHVPLAALTWSASQGVLVRTATLANEVSDAAELEGDQANLRVLVLTSGDAPTFVYTPLQRRVRGFPLPARWWILSHAPLPHRLTRTGPNAFTLEPVGGRFVDSVYEQVLRTPLRAFHVGDTVALDGATVRVEAVDGALATKIAVELDRPLDVAEVQLLAWKDRGLRRVAVPAIGATVELPWEPGVLAIGSGMGR